jgi:hypothetical protein
MPGIRRRPRRLVFSSFGVPVSIAYPRELEHHLPAVLPPARTRAPATAVPKRYHLGRRGERLLRAWEDDDGYVAEGDDPAFVLDILDSFIREHIACEAPDHVFVHAGAVAIEGSAVLFPGASFSGKSTLVAALVRAGATYMSDEFAVLDAAGRAIAYPRPISIRVPGSESLELDPKGLGPVDAGDPLPVAAVVVTEFRPDGVWKPQRLSPGTGGMRMFANTITAAKRPEQSLSAISRAVENAVVLESTRGDADELAPRLRDELTALIAGRT